MGTRKILNVYASLKIIGLLFSLRKYANNPVVSDFLELFDPHPWCGKAGDSKANHAQCPLFSLHARAGKLRKRSITGSDRLRFRGGRDFNHLWCGKAGDSESDPGLLLQCAVHLVLRSRA